jgi:hypothetical protein
MWSSWRRHFECNAARPVPTVEAAGVPAAWVRPLARSLAIFQAGEGGEGRIAREIEKVGLREIDDDYRAALKLFVREEGRHAKILAAAVRALGGQLRGKQWSERLFVGGRRLLGVRLKLLVLLAAEVVGIGLYGALASRLGTCSIGQALRELCADEAAHLEFHCDFFRTQTRSWWARGAFSLAWWAVAGAACVTVLVDHRGTLRALGVRGAPGRFIGLVAQVHARVVGGGALTAAPGLSKMPACRGSAS